MDTTERVYAPSRAAWREWLAEHHATKRKIWLIYHKLGTGKSRVAYVATMVSKLARGLKHPFAAIAHRG